MIECQVYDASFQNRWNDFVAASRNGTFLFDRRFMDYHADRFTDHSLLFFRGRRLLAVMPASQHGDELRSHGGLTYGGLVTSPRATMTDVIEMFEVLLSHMRDNGYKTLVYKKIPYIYARVPADEDLYAISRIENERSAHVTQCRQVSSAIDRDCRVRFFDIRRSGIRRAAAAGVEIVESRDFAPFWDVLAATLASRHGDSPVHSLDEITMLAGRFSDSIKLFEARLDGEVVAGVVMFDTTCVAHSQYIAASPAGRETGALDLLFDRLINHEFAGRRYFDFGISTEDHGRVLNENLIYQKEGFGGRAITYDIYTISI